MCDGRKERNAARCRKISIGYSIPVTGPSWFTR